MSENKADGVGECADDGYPCIVEEAHGFFTDSDPAGRELASERRGAWEFCVVGRDEVVLSASLAGVVGVHWSVRKTPQSARTEQLGRSPKGTKHSMQRQL